MSIYVLRGRYSSEALKGMIASPEDREAAIAKVVEKAGGRLLSYYLTFGDDDWLVIFRHHLAWPAIVTPPLAAKSRPMATVYVPLAGS